MARTQYSRFEVISSVVVYVIFLGAVAGIFFLTRKAGTATEQQKAVLREKGITVNRSGLTVQTSRVAPTREQAIASTQRAFEHSAKKVAAHKDAFQFGFNSGGQGNEGNMTSFAESHAPDSSLGSNESAYGSVPAPRKDTAMASQTGKDMSVGIDERMTAADFSSSPRKLDEASRKRSFFRREKKVPA